MMRWWSRVRESFVRTPPSVAGFYWASRLDEEGYACVPHEVVHIVNTINGMRVAVHGTDRLYPLTSFHWGEEVRR